MTPSAAPSRGRTRPSGLPLAASTAARAFLDRHQSLTIFLGAA